MTIFDAPQGALSWRSDGPDHAPAILFLNALGATMAMWDAQVDALKTAFRCIRYDMRGHGASVRGAAPPTIEDLADDAAALLDHLRIERAHLVGLSLGGMVAQAFAARHPARIHGLALLSTSAFSPDGWDARIALIERDGMATLAPTLMGRWFSSDFIESQPALVADWRTRLAGTDAKAYADLCRAIVAMDLRASDAQIAAPTLIVAGAKDEASPPAMMLDIQNRIAGAELCVLPNAGHLLNLERPDAVNRLLQEFLARVGAGGDAPQDARFQNGLAMRKSVLGTTHVEGSLARATAFNRPWQDFITRVAWHDIWCDPTLPRKTRSIITLSLMIALGHEEEFKLHLRPAINNGVTPDELRALIMQAAVYAGVPAANNAFRMAAETLKDIL